MSLRTALIQLSGYWMYRQNRLPIGCDLITDIRMKIRMPVRVILDVGANVGQTVTRFGKAFPSAKIYSFEPVSATFTLLKKNVHHMTNVSCHQEALGEEPGQQHIRVHTGKDSLLNSLKQVSMNEGGEVETIHVNTGDNFCAQHNISYVDLLKIDTEGYELEVLKGSRDLLQTAKIKAVYCEVGFTKSNQRNTFLNDVIDFLEPYSYEFYGLYDMYNKRMNSGSDYGSALFVKP
jgi:FkbM family methyltransferase